jgi:cytochrome b subunit of formate dehydrogenase
VCIVGFSNHLGVYRFINRKVLVFRTNIIKITTVGLFMDDEIFTTGPLNQFASQDLIDLAIKVHDLNSVVLQILIAMHILAILFYLLKNKINLIGPMISGNKWVQANESLSQPDFGQTHWIRFLVVFMLSAGVGHWLYTL